METVAFTIAAVLAALLVVRELMWRRALGGMRQRAVADGIRIREQEQLAHVGQLVSGLAQELKSPLQGVIGNTEVILASAGLGAESKDELREIQENVARAAGIVRSLLAFTETSLSRRWHDINELANRAVAEMRSKLDASGVRVNMALTDRLPLMYVDGRQLEKVIATLLSRPEPRSSQRRETVAVTLATRRGEPDDRLVIELDDRTAADLDELDEPSWSGDLVACRQIVQAHGGSLEVERPANGGYRFHLELPVTAGGADTHT